MCRDWQCDVTAVEKLITEKEDKCICNNECVFNHRTTSVHCKVIDLVFYVRLSCKKVLRMYKLCMCGHITEAFTSHTLAAIIKMAILSMTNKPSQMMQFSAGH